MKTVNRLFTASVCMSMLAIPVYYIAVRNLISVTHVRHAKEFGVFEPRKARLKYAEAMDRRAKAMSVREDNADTDNVVFKVELFPAWTTADPHDSLPTRRLYLYSAIIAIHRPPVPGKVDLPSQRPNQRTTDVHFVAFQEGSRFRPLTCCAILFNGNKVYSGGKAEADYPKKTSSRKNALSYDLLGKVYRCRFPFFAQQLRAAHVTLSMTSCPAGIGEYLVLQEPQRKPSGLAVCAKVAFGQALDPYKLVEWFETQRALGVDKVQLMECNNTKVVNRIFRHYQENGLLSLLPYKLPGCCASTLESHLRHITSIGLVIGERFPMDASKLIHIPHGRQGPEERAIVCLIHLHRHAACSSSKRQPWSRGFLSKGHDWIRFGIDTVLPLWDCRLRLAGYDYVMNIDLDEVILPRQLVSLKYFFKMKFMKQSTVGALLFHVQHFITDWGPVRPEAPLIFLRYMNSTLPRAETAKYVYIPSRVHQCHTHGVRPYLGFSQHLVPSSQAVIFHYRKCKPIWKFSCNTKRITDRSMLRLKDRLIPAVAHVLRKVNL